MSDAGRTIRRLTGRVLLVEDEPEICNVMLRRMSRYGVVVDVAEDYKKAIVKLKQQDYDLVLCDYNVTHARSWKTGGHILKYARLRHPGLPFYFVSGLFAMLFPEKQEKLLGMANGYVQKPISQEQLEEILLRHLKAAPP